MIGESGLSAAKRALPDRAGYYLNGIDRQDPVGFSGGLDEKDSFFSLAIGGSLHCIIGSTGVAFGGIKWEDSQEADSMDLPKWDMVIRSDRARNSVTIVLPATA
jgi:hypothetical protein